MKPSHPHPVKHASSSDDTVQTVLTTLISVVVLLGGAVGLYFWLQPDPVHPLSVQVKLDNRCDVINEAFMAASEPDGAKAYFDGGLALLQTRSDAKIYVRSSDKFPAFYYESPRVEAASKVTIKVVCDGGERIERTLNALKKQFQ